MGGAPRLRPLPRALGDASRTRRKVPRGPRSSAPFRAPRTRPITACTAGDHPSCPRGARALLPSAPRPGNRRYWPGLFALHRTLHPPARTDSLLIGTPGAPAFASDASCPPQSRARFLPAPFCRLKLSVCAAARSLRGLPSLYRRGDRGTRLLQSLPLGARSCLTLSRPRGL